MSRAVATSLVLVNWRGVFYQRYLLDRNVTALEGPNGAGKTTVMIAAYLVLLPDLSRLRFTNLGETGATGGDKGIWGRLGEAGRPAYAAIRVQLEEEEEVLMGVHIERKGEPSLTLTPFLVSGFPPEMKSSELLLEQGGTHDEVPSLSAFKLGVKKAGARIRVFSAAKDYFAALFEMGISPLRMSSEEEKGKLNEMLRASMTGGISRALTSELRSFLLKQDTGLGDTVVRMRANLRACHKTRLEVGEARSLQYEISGIYDAGQSMFTSALFAARQQARERQQGYASGVSALEQLEVSFELLRDEHQGAESEIEDFVVRLERQRLTASSVHDELLLLRRGAKAHELVSELSQELKGAEELAQSSEVQHSRAEAKRTAARGGAESARLICVRSAQGLADLQAGLDELHRKAHSYRSATTRLSELRAAFKKPELGVSELPGELESLKHALRELDGRRASRERETGLVDVRRGEFDSGMLALRQLTGKELFEEPYQEAREVLSDFLVSERTAALLPTLERELSEVRRAGLQQASVCARVEALGLTTTLTSEQLASVANENEATLNEALEQRRSVDERVRKVSLSERELSSQISLLEDRAAQWERLSAAAKRVELATGSAVGRDANSLESWFGEQERSRLTLQAKLRDVGLRLEAALQRSAELHAPIGAFEPELLRLRDEIGGELLALRYDEIEPNLALLIEARLGPMLGAIVVADVEEAARKLKDIPRELDDVWLIPAGADFLGELLGDSSAPAEEAGGRADVLVRNGETLRVSRLAARPTLGRKARDKAAKVARELAESLTVSQEEQEGALRICEAALRDARVLTEGIRIWRNGDPGPELDEVRLKLAAVLSEAQADVGVTDEQLAEMRKRSRALRELQRDAYLLDQVDTSAHIAQLEQDVEQARAAQQRLVECGSARAQLERQLDGLRATPPADEEIRAWALDEENLIQERDRLFVLREGLLEVIGNEQALEWCDSERILTERSELVPELKREHERAEKRAEATRLSVDAAEASWEEVTLSRQKTAASVSALEAHLARAEEEWRGIGAHLANSQAESTVAETRLAAKLASAEAAIAALAGEEKDRLQRHAVVVERLSQMARQLEKGREHLEAEKAIALPDAAAWESLSALSESSGLLKESLSSVHAEAYAERSSQTLKAEAHSRCELLRDRMGAAPGGQEVADLLSDALLETEVSGERYLGLWQRVRSWLERRLPAQVADVAEPLLALERLSDNLTRLEVRLARQEALLLGASEDVARSIDVQVRRAGGQVRRLNEYLKGVSFGSIHAIRVCINRSEKMEQVLNALRDGSAQELLFQSTLPIEDALEEIFRRYGGGRGGGQRIVDYREYLELSVEVKRRSEDASWEVANPTRVSTGEAIGVGAALMMVILREWERDANLLRNARTIGSMRFLFLDEANRLSPDNLKVLFELCQTLELQLLIAAPEVAQADGNTTYRLVRRSTDDGGEEVIVSGRRSSLPESGLSQPDASGADVAQEVLVEGGAVQLSLST